MKKNLIIGLSAGIAILAFGAIAFGIHVQTAKPVAVEASTTTGWYVAGTHNSWDKKGTQMFLSDKTNVEAVYYGVQFGANGQFKVTNGTWDEAYPANNYVITGGAGYYDIYLYNDNGNRTVNAVASKWDQAAGYYVVGSVGGSISSAWAPDTTSPLYNASAGSFSNVSLIAGQELKVCHWSVQNDHGTEPAADSWIGTPQGANYVVGRAGTYSVNLVDGHVSVKTGDIRVDFTDVLKEGYFDNGSYFAYYWNTNEQKYADWPGTTVSVDANHVATIPLEGYNYFIFTDKVDGSNGEQTLDLTVSDYIAGTTYCLELESGNYVLKTAYAVCENWANGFINNSVDYCDVGDTDWAAQEAAFNELNPSAKAEFTNATANANGNAVEKAAYRYDFAVNSKGKAAWAGVGGKRASGALGIPLPVNAATGSIYAVSAIALTGAAAAVGIGFLRKKKAL